MQNYFDCRVMML